MLIVRKAATINRSAMLNIIYDLGRTVDKPKGVPNAHTPSDAQAQPTGSDTSVSA